IIAKRARDGPTADAPSVVAPVKRPRCRADPTDAPSGRTPGAPAMRIEWRTGMHRRPRPIPAAAALVALLLALPAASAHAAPALPAQPSAVDFGVVNVEWGEQSSSVSIRNDGAADAQLSGASVDGDGAFRVAWDGCAGQLLSPGASCNVGVGFDPAGQ